MSKVKVNSISKQEKERLLGELFDLIYKLNSKKELIDFLIGLLTPSESLMLARRIQVAKQVLEGKTYDDIREELGVSYRTITVVEQWLDARDGAYRKVLSKLLKKNKSNKVYIERETGSLLDRYPQHRFLKDLLGL